MVSRSARPIIVLIGLPGSGKSTWAKAFLDQYPAYQIISTDAMRAVLYGDEAIQGDWPEVWKRVYQALATGVLAITQGQRMGILYDATNVRRRYRRQLIADLRTLGYGPIGAIWFDVPLGHCLRRNMRRSRQVPEVVLWRMDRYLQVASPCVTEGFDWLVRWQPGDRDGPEMGTVNDGCEQRDESIWGSQTYKPIVINSCNP